MLNIILRASVTLLLLGVLLPIAMVAKTCFFALSPEQKSEQTAYQDWEARKRQNLHRAVQVAAAQPCQSTIEFVYFPEQGWMVTCPDCLMTPASTIYPPEVLAHLARFVKEEKVALLTLFHLQGKCVG